MNKSELSRGSGRTRVSLSCCRMGDGLIVRIYNDNAHIGAMALGEYDSAEQRVSTSVITRLGHKDDAVALKAAYLIAKHTRKPACVIAGIHIDNITENEITAILDNANKLVEELMS